MRYSKERLESYRNIIDRFCLATGQTQYEVSQVAAWAIDRGEVALSQDDLRHYHAEIFREASRTHTITDRHGNKVRVRHCVEVTVNGEQGFDKPVQKTLWAHADEAPTSFLIESLRQRRSRCAADIRQLKADLGHINEILQARGHRPIQMTFDFSSPDEAEPKTAG